MAREAEYRIVFEGMLETVTPLHIGSGREGLLSDAMLARDGQGNLVIPGSSLAGPIRVYLERYFSQPDQGESAENNRRSLLGFQRSDEGQASRLIVEDSLPAGELTTEVRDSVGIGRASSAAVDQLKFDREILPAGVAFPLRLQWDCRDEEQRSRFNEAIGSLVAALADEGIRFGACVTRGLGRVRLKGNHQTRSFALRTTRGMIDWLGYLAGAGKTNDSLIQLPDSNFCEPPSLDLEIEFEPVGPLMVKAAIDGAGADMLPLITSRHGGTGAPPRVLPVIPGTSIRGALRSDAERLLRTLLGIDSADHQMETGTGDPSRFQDSLEQLPLICWIFGRAGQDVEATAEIDSPDGAEAPDAEVRQGRGALTIDDCTADPSRFPILGPAQWAEIAGASVDIAPGSDKSPLRRLLNELDLQSWTTGFRVAIDRWTGGAAEGMFFKILEPRSVPWQPIRIKFDLERLPEQALKPALALLFLVFDRFAQGLIPLGHGVNRGLGDLRVKRIGIRGRSLPQGLENLRQFTFVPSPEETSLLSSLDAGFREDLAEHWSEHLRQPTAAGEVQGG